jgi:hypothetical protein
LHGQIFQFVIKRGRTWPGIPLHTPGKEAGSTPLPNNLLNRPIPNNPQEGWPGGRYLGSRLIILKGAGTDPNEPKAWG